jgi:hypothetical protein
MVAHLLLEIPQLVTDSLAMVLVMVELKMALVLVEIQKLVVFQLIFHNIVVLV